MKQLREHIKKEIKFLMEEKYPAPPEILDALKNTLKLKPLIRYVKALKAVNDLDKSYHIFLHNGHTFLISYLGNEEGNFKVTISSKEYDLLAREEKPLAIGALNRLLTTPLPPNFGKTNPEDAETDDTGGGGGTTGGGGGATTFPGEEPADDTEEPADEEPADTEPESDMI